MPADPRDPLARHAAGWAALAAANVLRPYPYLVTHLLRGPEPPEPHTVTHPAFHGSYDWHSAVHSHWLLVRLLRRAPGHLDADAARGALGTNLTAPRLAAEARQLRDRPGFSLPYGQAWLTMLGAECRAATTEAVPGADGWAAALEPAVAAADDALHDWLATATYPVRHGTHANTAFALGLLLDAGGPVAEAAARAALRWFSADRDYPGRYEPSAHDFLSPALTEADTMRRVLPGPRFADWLTGFLPGLAAGQPATLLTPPVVSDPADPLIGHLIGLSLSRAAALRAIASALPPADLRVPVLTASAATHYAAAAPHVATGDFTTDHWLATFAVLALEAGA